MFLKVRGVTRYMLVIVWMISWMSGHLGKFQLSLHWMNLGNQPVEILIEDVYLLVVPSPQTSPNPEEDEQRAQAVKQERLESAELLHVRSQESQAGETSRWVSYTEYILMFIQEIRRNLKVSSNPSLLKLSTMSKSP